MKKLTVCSLVMALVACTAKLPVALKSVGSQPGDSRFHKVADVPSGPNSYTVRCVSASTCWVGDYSNQWRTNDEGKHWQLAYSSSSDDNKINMAEYDAQVAWLLTAQSLLKTADGGRTWDQQAWPLPDHSAGEIKAIAFLPGGRIGWAGGGLYRPFTKEEERTGTPRNISDPPSHTVLKPAVFYTNDGGTSWTPQSIPNDTGSVSSFTFADEEQGLAFESSGVFYTKDGGKNWKRVTFQKSCTDAKYLEGYDTRPVQVFFLDSQDAWLAFEDGRIARSSDGGKTWCDLLAPGEVSFEYYDKYFKSIHFTDPSNGWGLGVNRSLYETKDGGKTWAKTTSGQFDDMFFLKNEHVGWLVSKDGLFRLND